MRLAGVYLAAALFPFFLSARPVSVGVTVGVPISPNSQNLHALNVVPPAGRVNGQACLNLAPTICGPNDFSLIPTLLAQMLMPVSGGAFLQRWGFSMSGSI